MQDTLSNTKSRKYINSSSFIMALLFTVLCGLAALSLGYFINFFAKGHFVQNTEAVLDAEIRYIEASGFQIPQNSPQLYLFLQKDGSLPDSIPQEVSRLAEGIVVFTHRYNHKRYAAKIHTLSDNKKILVGTDITDISKDFRFMQWIGIASIFFVMAVVFVSYVISIFVVGGTNKIANTAQEIIDTGDLSRRVSVGSRWDDLSNMTAVFNTLLERMQELMQGVRQVSDNIAHDLRTPLARMRSKIEDIKDETIKENLLKEADHILSTFNALLRISRIESEKRRSQFSDINITKLLHDVIDFYEPLAEEQNITIIRKLEDIAFYGDRDLLFQAYANIIDNAIKFTPGNGNITVVLSQEKSINKIRIEIADTGPGIEEDTKDTIFQRFYRGEKSRSSTGTGLGLSLVKAVIDLHNGAITVENTYPGLRIITFL